MFAGRRGGGEVTGVEVEAAVARRRGGGAPVKRSRIRGWDYGIALIPTLIPTLGLAYNIKKI